MSEKTKFSEDIQQILQEKFPDKDMYNMSLEELELFKEEVLELRQQYSLLETGAKLCGNAAYGASANKNFYFYNVNLAADITGECRLLTKTMWSNINNFFHETLWERKDLWEKFDFALDFSKKDWYSTQVISCYSDTDSVYSTYGSLFECFTPEYQAKYDTERKKVEWILKFNKEFFDGQNTRWCEEIYAPRHADNKHIFELETVNYAQLVLCKKRYLKAVSFNKGKHLEPPKISGTGIEIIKTTTPALCREILTDLTKSLLFESPNMSKDDYILYFNDKLKNWKKKFYSAEPEQISASINVGSINKYTEEWQENLIFKKRAPVSVKAAARYNHLAYKNGEGDKFISSGKIKYYNIRLSDKVGDYFGFPAGEFPSWAPPMDKQTQWSKTVIEPINRFLEVMDIPKMNCNNIIQYDLFGNMSSL